MSRGKRRSLNDEQRFVFGDSEPEQPTPTPNTQHPTGEQPKPEPKQLPKSSPWGGIEAPEREATIRLNVDIPVSLNDQLAAKARQLRKPKTELVRILLAWALTQDDE